MASVAEASAARAAARREAANRRRGTRQGGSGGGLAAESLETVAADTENRPNAAAAATAAIGPPPAPGQPGGTPLGELAPDVPDVFTTDTGISNSQAPTQSGGNPTAGSSTMAELFPDDPEGLAAFKASLTPEQLANREATDRDIEIARGGGLTEVEGSQGLVDATGTQSEADFQSQRGTQKEAETISDSIREGIAGTDERVSDIQDELSASKADLDGRIDAALTAVEAIPGQVQTEFEKLKAKFDTSSQAALGDIDDKAEAAMGDVMTGRSEAMQAAVVGIQGNINTAVAKIQSDPNLTASQKSSMIAQTRLAGASAIAPAIGANILAFNQLQADVATKFGGFTTQLQTQIVSETGAFGRASAQAFAEATVASKNITNNLLSTQANSDSSYISSQGVLEGMRLQANLGGNQLMMTNLPNTADPVLNVIDAASATMITGTDIITRNFERLSLAAQKIIDLALIRFDVGTSQSRIANAFLAGDDFKESVLGAALQFGAESGGNPPPIF